MQPGRTRGIVRPGGGADVGHDRRGSVVVVVARVVVVIGGSDVFRVDAVVLVVGGSVEVVRAHAFNLTAGWSWSRSSS
jgi:hypothetical protein